MTTATYATTLTAVSCASCGIGFGLPKQYAEKRQEDHVGWFCPNGHNNYFPGETEAEKLRRLLRSQQDRTASIVAERDQIAASLRTTKGVVTKMRKRAIVGACQFCHRTFANVTRHVATKHPDISPEVPA